MRVSHITTQTLRFYRQTTKPTHGDIAEVLDSVAALYQRRLHDAGAKLERQSRLTEPVKVYAGELRQVIANLVGNSLDALGHGGRIVVRESPATDWVSGRKGVRVTVADGGHGMSAEVVRRVFEPFFSTKNDTGTGLGLWVSKEIVEKHGGSIRVRSRQKEPHRGTAFSVFLPLLDADETDAAV
jgi:signal transduction histidine kinase